MAGRVAGRVVTLDDVAAEAGVSLATASRVLNGGNRRVRPELSERVRQAAAALKYLPNAPAQAMARGRTDTVGLVVADIADPYFSTIAAGLISEAERQGLLVSIACTLHHAEREPSYVATLRGQHARAAILVGSRTSDRRLASRLKAELAAFEAAGGRIVLVSQATLPFDTVVVDNVTGARALADSLHELGYRSFAVLAGPAELITCQERVTGFRRGLSTYGVEIPEEHVVYGAFTRDGGYAAMNELLDRGIEADCIFAVNDIMAVGGITALRERGVRTPDDVAIAGFDDVAQLRDVTPSLTTVHLALEELGALALELALQPRAERPRVRRFRGELVVRESTPERPERSVG
jgi:LacI family transcriptional regulator